MVTTAETDEFSKFPRWRAPSHPRTNETIGGGFIVIERTPKKKRLRPSMWPHELATAAQAVEAIERLQKKHPDRSFCIFHQIAESPAPKPQGAFAE